MKIEIDTIEKTIVLKESITLGDLIVELERLKVDYKEYSIKQETPYTYIPYYPYTNPQPLNPIYYPPYKIIL